MHQAKYGPLHSVRRSPHKADMNILVENTQGRVGLYPGHQPV